MMRKGSGELSLANSQILEIADWLLIGADRLQTVILAFLKSITPISDSLLKIWLHKATNSSSPEPFVPPQINTKKGVGP